MLGPSDKACKCTETITSLSFVSTTPSGPATSLAPTVGHHGPPKRKGHGKFIANGWPTGPENHKATSIDLNP